MIRKILAFPDTNPLPLYINIASAGHLAPFFDLSPLKLSDSPDIIELQGKETPIYLLYFANVFTSLPLQSCQTKPLGQGCYLARITITDIFPNMRMNNGLGFFLSNLTQDTLEGFEEGIPALFLNTPQDPKTLIGQPLAHFISPTPLEFQKLHLSKFTLAEYGRFKKTFDAIYADDAAPPVDLSNAAATSREINHGLLIEALQNQSAFLHFPAPISTLEQDFILSIHGRHLKGDFPAVAIGPGTTGHLNLLDDDYLAGANANPTAKRFIIKRHGLMVQCAETPLPDHQTFKLDFCKIGTSLFFYLNEVRILEFFDEEFVARQRAYLTLVIRASSICSIEQAEIRTRPSSAAENNGFPPQHIAAIVQRPGRYCLLSRFNNNAISSTYNKPIAGYQPVEITALQTTIKRLDQKSRNLEKHTQVLGALLKNYQTHEGDPLVGSSEIIERVRQTADTVAASNATVLIEGPTGSGKEVLARYLHHHSGRREAPFVKVDCATIPPNLIESQLFGHEKGAFTGAGKLNIGLFERAEGGTLFLDEVGNLPLDIQAKLLHFFSDFSITRVGGSQTIRVNARCIVATNANLNALVETGRFRSDLYYRISVIALEMPPLCERSADIPELAHTFLLQFAALNKKRIHEISADAIAKLRDYGWPGNVRELKNVIERAVVFAPRNIITPDLILFSEERKAIPSGKSRKSRPSFTLAKTEPSRIRAMLAERNGNVTSLAREIGVTRESLHQYLRKQGILAEDYRKGY